MNCNQSSNKIIVALDIDDLYEAKSLAEMLSGKIGYFKIGLEFFTKFGQDGIDIISKSACIMLDLKLHDISNTVSRTMKVISNIKKVVFTTIHVAGGKEMILQACDAARNSNICVIGVTVLTSLNQNDCLEVGIISPIRNIAIKRARLAVDCGCHGIVSSPHELKRLRYVLGPSPIIISPGIRLDDNVNDQKRVAFPYEAIKNGADYLVIGRPITTAKNPLEVVEYIASEIEKANV